MRLERASQRFKPGARGGVLLAGRVENPPPFVQPSLAIVPLSDG